MCIRDRNNTRSLNLRTGAITSFCIDDVQVGYRNAQAGAFSRKALDTRVRKYVEAKLAGHFSKRSQFDPSAYTLSVTRPLIRCLHVRTGVAYMYAIQVRACKHRLTLPNMTGPAQFIRHCDVNSWQFFLCIFNTRLTAFVIDVNKFLFKNNTAKSVV